MERLLHEILGQDQLIAGELRTPTIIKTVGLITYFGYAEIGKTLNRATPMFFIKKIDTTTDVEFTYANNKATNLVFDSGAAEYAAYTYTT
jgi:hypothetical protein